MSWSRKTIEANKVQDALNDPNFKNVRFGTYDVEKKRVFWIVSVTRFPQGYTLRLNRKAFARKLDVATALTVFMDKVAEVKTDRSITDEVGRYETWTDSERAERLFGNVTVITLDRKTASELLGITRNALNKRIKRAGGEYVLENGSVVV